MKNENGFAAPEWMLPLREELDAIGSQLAVWLEEHSNKSVGERLFWACVEAICCDEGCPRWSSFAHSSNRMGHLPSGLSATSKEAVGSAVALDLLAAGSFANLVACRPATAERIERLIAAKKAFEEERELLGSQEEGPKAQPPRI